MPSFGNPYEGIDLNKKLSTEEIVRVLRFLVSAEYEAVQIYQQAVNSFDDPLFKQVINSIIDEEKVHAGEFLTLLKTLQPNEESFYEKGKKEVLDIKIHKHI
jgi:rubrerythrin